MNNRQILTYSAFGTHLRIGNMLYSLSMLLKYSKKFNRDLVLPNYYLWKYLKHNPFTIDNSAKGEITFHFTDDRPETAYIDKFFEENNDKSIEVNLNPFFQSESNWIDYKDYILEMLEFKEEEIQKIKDQYSDILSKPTIGISVRLGTDFMNDNGFYHLKPEWFISALNHQFPDWRNTHSICVFSDNIVLSKEIFKDFPFFYAEENKTYILQYDSEHYHSEKAMNHLILGSLMDNFISSNSTFSFWCSYLSQNRKDNKEGKVVCSGRNFDNHYYERSKNNETFYPSNWIIHPIN